MHPQSLLESATRSVRALGTFIVAISLLAGTLMAAAQERAVDHTTDPLHAFAITQPNSAASAPKHPIQPKDFFFGWVEFDVDPNSPGGVPGFDPTDPSAPQRALAATRSGATR